MRSSHPLNAWKKHCYLRPPLVTSTQRKPPPSWLMVALLVLVLFWPREMSQPKKCYHYTMPVVRSPPLKQDIRKLIVKLWLFTGQSNVFTYLYMAKNSRSTPTISLLFLCSTIHLQNHLQGQNAGSWSYGNNNSRWSIALVPQILPTMPPKTPLETQKLTAMKLNLMSHLLQGMPY